MEGSSCERTGTQGSGRGRANAHRRDAFEALTRHQPGRVGAPVLCRQVLLAVRALLSQLLDQFKGKRASGSLISGKNVKV